MHLVLFILMGLFLAFSQKPAKDIPDGAQDSLAFGAPFVRFPFKLAFTFVEFVSKFSFQLGLIAVRHVCLLQDARIANGNTLPGISWLVPFLVETFLWS